jgi:hypothetical protein
MEEAARRVSQAQEEDRDSSEHEPARKRYRSQSGGSEGPEVASAAVSHSSASPPTGSYSLPELAAVASALAPYDIPASSSRSPPLSAAATTTTPGGHHHHHHHHHRHHHTHVSPSTDDLNLFRQGLVDSIVRGRDEIERLSAFVQRGEALLAKLDEGEMREDELRENRLRELLASVPVQAAVPLRFSHARRGENTAAGQSEGQRVEGNGGAEEQP